MRGIQVRARRPTITISVVLLATAGLVAVGVVVGAMFLPEPTPASVRSDSTDRSIAVSEQSFDDTRSVAVKAAISRGAVLTLADSGRVTRTDCAVGASVKSGTSPMTIDDRPVLALATGTPLWRDLSMGSKGEDVSALQTELRRLGHAVEPDGKFGASTKQAVSALQRSALGVSAPTGSLSAASVLWLPAATVDLETCDASTGELFTGGRIASVGGELESLRLAAVPSGAVPGERIVRFGEATAPVNDDGVVSDAKFLALVRASPTFQLSQSEDTTGALTVDYALANPLDVAVVPPGALFAVLGTTGCVADGTTLIPVTVVSSSLGQTMVDFGEQVVPVRVDLTPQADGQACS